MKKSIKSIVIGFGIVACFIIGYFWAVQPENHIDYNVDTDQFVHENPKIVMEKIKNKEEGIYYFGFAACPWCIELVPILNEVLEEVGQKAYVVDIKAKNFTDEMRSQLDLLYFTYYNATTSVPFILIVKKDGTVQTHVGTIEGHDAKTDTLTSRQKLELKKILLIKIQ